MEARRSVRLFSPEPVPRRADRQRAHGRRHRAVGRASAALDVRGRQRSRDEGEAARGRREGGARVLRAPRDDEWKEAIEPIGTDWVKTHITDAPYVIVVFEQPWRPGPDGTKIKHYYVRESVGIAVGFLLAALQVSGLCALTHSPSPMGFLRELLDRPENERPFILIPVGYPGGRRGRAGSRAASRSTRSSTATQPPAATYEPAPDSVERGLRRGEPGERHAERRAADVVEPELVAERDRARLAAVLAADAELELGLRAAAALDGDAHQVADAVDVDRLERVALEDPVLAGSASGTCPPRRRARTRASSASGRSCRTRRSRRPRRSRRRAARRAAPRSSSRSRCSTSGASSAHTSSVSSRSRASSSRKPTSGCITSTSGASPGPLLHRTRRARDRADLHLVDLRELQAEPAAARAEHRVRLVQRADPRAHLLVGRLLPRSGRNSCSGGSSSRIVTGSPAIASKIPSKSDCWNGSSRSSAARRPGLGVGEDHLLHDRQPLLAEEHVLGAAEADALGAELARARRVLGVVGVRAHLQAAQRRRPSRGSSRSRR